MTARIAIPIFDHGFCRYCGGTNVRGFIDPDVAEIVFDCDDCMHISGIKLDPAEWNDMHKHYVYDGHVNLAAFKRGVARCFSSCVNACFFKVRDRCCMGAPRWLWRLCRRCGMNERPSNCIGYIPEVK